jgi:glucose/mannose-6-phosphate isomerase
MMESTESTPEPTLVDLAEQLDQEGMVGHLRQSVHDLRNGFASVNPEHFPWLNELKKAPWSGVLCLGMGGSAAGGDFLATLAATHGHCPVMVHRDYTLPAWFDATWLVLATSHSGNTEETLQAAETALRGGATVIAIATGGELAGFPELYPRCYLIPSVGGQPPRTAFGHIFSRQLACLEHLGLFPSVPQHVRDGMLKRLQANNEHFDVLTQPEGDIALLATSLLDRPIAVLGPTEMGPALNRFKNQMNENAARFVRVGMLPEMNHNESVAWGGIGPHADPDSNEQALMLLTWNGMHPRVKQRLDWMVAHATTETAWNLVGEGESFLECLLYHCLVMDWLSITVALLHGKDPAQIAPINALKAHLDSIQ